MLVGYIVDDKILCPVCFTAYKKEHGETSFDTLFLAEITNKTKCSSCKRKLQTDGNVL